LEEPVQGRLGLDDPSDIAWIYLDTGNIVVKVRATGASANEIELELESVLGSTSDNLLHDFEKKFKEISFSKSPDSLKATSLFMVLDSFVKKYPNHNLSSLFLQEACLSLF